MCATHTVNVTSVSYLSGGKATQATLYLGGGVACSVIFQGRLLTLALINRRLPALETELVKSCRTQILKKKIQLVEKEKQKVQTGSL